MRDMSSSHRRVRADYDSTVLEVFILVNTPLRTNPPTLGCSSAGYGVLQSVSGKDFASAQREASGA